MEQLYLVGKNIAHSVSPAMYAALYNKLGLDWRYEAVDLASDKDARRFLDSNDWLSANATTPYKQFAADLASVKAASVQLSGGANMLFRANEQIVGLNTDGIGCVRAIQQEGFSFQDGRVVVCGTGPTSLAIVAAAAQAGAARVALIGRSRDRTKEVLEAFLTRYKKLAYATFDFEPVRPDERSFRSAYEEPSFVFGSYETSTQEIAGADILIDATPLGMNAGDPAPFAENLLKSQQLVFDVVYAQGDSQLLRAARAAGVPAFDGRTMVVAQAVENAIVLLNQCEVPHELSWDEMFDLMSAAAQ